MTQSLRTVLFRGIVVGAVVFVIGYGLFEARRLITGPRVSLAAPQNGSVVQGPLVHVRGQAENISYLSINGTQAFVDENGAFDQEFSPAPGFTEVEVRARDRFGREISRSASFVLANWCPA